MTTEQQIATFLLKLISTATASCDDGTQGDLSVTKQWLRAMQSGQIVVVAAPKMPEMVAP